MAVTLGTITLDAAHTTVREEYEEVGGRNARRVRLSGLIVGKSTLAEIEAALDAILDAASPETGSVELSLRTGRRLLVRRRAFTREIAAESLTGSFVLDLDADDPFEYAQTETSASWTIAASGATKLVSAAGNVFSKPTITLVADGDLVNPCVSDGTRAITYVGVVADGSVLVFDADSAQLTLDGEDVTPYSLGLFPKIQPGGTTLTYTDDESSSHSAAATVAFRSRWW